MSKTERINVNITRIISPTKFWLKIQTDDYNNEFNRHVYSRADEQNTNEYGNLSWIKGIFQLITFLSHFFSQYIELSIFRTSSMEMSFGIFYSRRCQL